MEQPPWFVGLAFLVRTTTNGAALAAVGSLIGGPWPYVMAGIGGVMGAIHGGYMAAAGTYDLRSVGGIIQFVDDNTWSLPNSVVASLWATLNVWNKIEATTSAGTGTLYLKTGWFGDYDTTFGNVTVGTVVPKHEAVHALQARIFGPAFYPIFVASYVIVTLLPYWLIYHRHATAPIKSVLKYFKCGVYPHTWFEEWAYAVQGSPPC